VMSFAEAFRNERRTGRVVRCSRRRPVVPHGSAG
jgi:hypothetical protein